MRSRLILLLAVVTVLVVAQANIGQHAIVVTTTEAPSTDDGGRALGFGIILLLGGLLVLSVLGLFFFMAVYQHRSSRAVMQRATLHF